MVNNTDKLNNIRHMFANTKWENRLAFTCEDVHNMLAVPLFTIYDLCRKGKLKCYKVGRHHRIAREDLVEFIQKQKDNSIIL